MSVHLVLGGARSGKSRYAQARAEAHAGPVCLIVTAEVRDAEMAARIAKHRAERPAHWQVVEAPFALPEAIAQQAAAGTLLLVDCLTLWLSNLLCERPDALDAGVEALCAALAAAPGEVVAVSNEVGWGIVPENALARRFRDEQGRLNQRVAALAERVTLVAAGLPLSLKGQA